MKRRIFSIVMALALCLCLLPGAAWAIDDADKVIVGDQTLAAGSTPVYAPTDGSSAVTELDSTGGDSSAETTYAVTLNTNSGVLAEGKDITSYDMGESVTLPTAADITRIGYTFEGWYEDADFSGEPVTAIAETDTGEKTFYAKWVSDGSHVYEGDLDFTDDSTSVGDLETDGYNWDKTSNTLTLNKLHITGTVTLPEGETVTIVTDEASSIKKLTFKSADGYYAPINVTFSGEGELTVQERIEMSGNGGSTLTVNKGAALNAPGGIGIGQGASVGGTVTVNGTLTAAQAGGDAIIAGNVHVGSTGTLKVSGQSGIVSAGMPNDDDPIRNNLDGAFTLESGGRLEADCSETVISVYSSNGVSLKDLDKKKVIVVPTGYLPKGHELTLSEDEQTILIPGGDEPFTISKDNVPKTGSSGSGGSATHLVNTKSGENGTVTVEPKNAGKGTTVTVTVTPDKGYVLDKLTVTGSDGSELELTGKGGGKYTFTMPGRAVTVTAVFAPLVTSCDGGEGCPSLAFSDLDVTKWYHEATDFVLSHGLMSGCGDGSFAPVDNLTRAQFAQILYNKEGRPSVAGGSSFTDVADDSWYAPAVIWAAENGIVTGYGNGLFGPGDSITREQLAVMLWRYAGSPSAAGEELDFTDAGAISAYALGAMRWAVENGVINGLGSGLLGPHGLATRAQVAQMLKNYMTE